MLNSKFFFLFFFVSLFSRCNAAYGLESQLCIVTTSSPGLLTSPDRQNFLSMGHKLALKNFSEQKKIISSAASLIREYPTDSTDTGNLTALQKAIEGGCKVFLGMYTSREALLAGPLLKKGNAFAFSAAAGADKISQFYPNVLSAVSSIDDHSSVMARTITNWKTKDVFIFQQSGDLYSKSLVEALKLKLKSPSVMVEVSDGGRIAPEMLTQLAASPSATFVLAMYPLPSVELLSVLKTQELNRSKIRVMGSPSWVFDAAAFSNRKALFSNFQEVVSTNSWDKNNASAKQFIASFEKEYSTKPQVLAAYAYDSTFLALSCIADTFRIEPQKVRACLQNSNVKGVTGTFAYQDTPFRKAQIHISKFEFEGAGP
jgi:ABC-type branched-subunit amino acid transport system substrate-binding protein